MSRIEDEVCEKIQERAQVGLAKYGVSMEDEKLSRLKWLIHAQEEAMDLAVYLQKLIEIEKEEIEEFEQMFPVKFVFESLIGNRNYLPYHELLIGLMECHEVNLDEAQKMFDWERHHYIQSKQNSTSVISKSYWWNQLGEKYEYELIGIEERINAPNRCTANTKFGSRCTVLVDHEKEYYNNPHKPCNKKEMLCLHHCDCGAIHKVDKE